MNIEQLLPELKFLSSKSDRNNSTTKIYTCQKCINHNLTVARKNHKYRCPFLHCSCEKCQLVDRRRSLNAELAQVKAMEESMPMLSPIMMSMHDANKERLPHCQRCAQHNLMNRLKGHKRYCPFRNCTCAKCSVVAERQRLMADQIKLRRKQKKQKTITTYFHGSQPEQQSQKSPEDQISLSPTPSHLSSTSTNENKKAITSKNCNNKKNKSQSLLPSTFLPQPQLPPLQLPQFSHIPFPSFPIQPLDWRLAFAFCALKQQQQQQYQQHQNIFPQNFSFFKNESTTNSP